MASDRNRDNRSDRGRQPEGARRQVNSRAQTGDGPVSRSEADRAQTAVDRDDARLAEADGERAERRKGESGEGGADIEKRRQRNRRRQRGRRAVSVIWKIVGCLLLAAFLFMAGLFIYCRCVRVSYLNAVQLLFTGRFAEFADALNTDRDVTSFTVKDFLRNEYADDSDRFICLGGALYKVSNNSIVRYTDTGNMAQETRTDMNACRCDRAGGYLLVYDMGGRRAYLVTADMILTMDLPDVIRTATVNASGYMAFVTEPADYGSAVAIYGPDGKEISTRYIQSDYAVWAGVAPDNSTYCIDKISLDDLSSSSYMEYSRIGEPNAYAQEVMRGRLIADCVYLPCGAMVCITDSEVLLLGGDRTVASEHDVSGISAVSVTPEGRVLIAATVAGSGGNENRIMIFDTDGRYSFLTTEADVATMDADGRRICISNGSGIVVMDYSGAMVTSLAADEERARDAILYGDSYLVVFRQTVDKRRF